MGSSHSKQKAQNKQNRNNLSISEVFPRHYVNSVSNIGNWTTKLRTLNDESGVCCVAFSPDNKFFATASGDDHSIAYVRNNVYIITGNEEVKQPDARRQGLVRIFKTDTQQVHLSIPHTAPAWAVAFLPDGISFVTGSGSMSEPGSGLLQWFSTETGALIRGIRYPSKVRCLAIHRSSNVGDLLAAGHGEPGKQSGLQILDAGSGQARITLSTAATVCSLAFIHDGATIIAGYGWDYEQAGMSMFRVADGSLLRVLSYPTSVCGIAPSPVGPTVVTAHGWSLNFYITPRTYEGQDSDEKILRADGRSLVWNTSNGLNTQQEVPSGNLPIISVAFSPNGKLLATGGGVLPFRGEVAIYTTGTYELVHGFDTIAPVFSLAFSPDGSKLLAGCGWNGVRGSIEIHKVSYDVKQLVMLNPR